MRLVERVEPATGGPARSRRRLDPALRVTGRPSTRRPMRATRIVATAAPIAQLSRQFVCRSTSTARVYSSGRAQQVRGDEGPDAPDERRSTDAHRPGRERGRVTCQNTCASLAPRLRADSSSSGSMAWSTATRTSTQYGRNQDHLAEKHCEEVVDHGHGLAHERGGEEGLVHEAVGAEDDEEPVHEHEHVGELGEHDLIRTSALHQGGGAADLPGSE